MLQLAGHHSADKDLSLSNCQLRSTDRVKEYTAYIIFIIPVQLHLVLFTRHMYILIMRSIQVKKTASDDYLRGSQNLLGIIVFILYAIYFQLAPEKRHIGLVISPLKSLMLNQVESLRKKGIRSVLLSEITKKKQTITRR